MATSVTSADLNRIYDQMDAQKVKLDSVKDSLAQLSSDVRANFLLCKDCRPKVMGNGKDGLVDRVTNLEADSRASKRFIAGMIALSSGVGSLVGGGVAVITFLVK